MDINPKYGYENKNNWDKIKQAERRTQPFCRLHKKGDMLGVRMTADQDPKSSSITTAEELREDLEAIAESDLPFAHDAKEILKALDQAENK